MNPKITIAVPFHQTPKTAFYLSRLLTSIAYQSFTDYEIVLTSEGAFARNHNASIMKATGELVQMMQMDDYFSSQDSLKRIVEGFNEDTIWQITGCLHDENGTIGRPHQPEWTDDIYKGNNRLGSVSTLSFRREHALFFEEPLTWLVDCDLYYRYFIKYGAPELNPTANVVIDCRTDRLTHTLSDELKAKEIDYLTKLYGNQ
jgi:hypothetical protein